MLHCTRTHCACIAVKISDIDLLAPLTGLSGLFSSLNLGTGSFELLRCFCDCTDRYHNCQCYLSTCSTAHWPLPANGKWEVPCGCTTCLYLCYTNSTAEICSAIVTTPYKCVWCFDDPYHFIHVVVAQCVDLCPVSLSPVGLVLVSQRQRGRATLESCMDKSNEFIHDS